MGSIPLLWSWKRAWTTNLLRLGCFFAIVAGVNLIRLWLGFMLLRIQIPWVWGHEVVAGFFYFGILAWIVRERRWLSSPNSHRSHPLSESALAPVD